MTISVQTAHRFGAVSVAQTTVWPSRSFCCPKARLYASGAWQFPHLEIFYSFMNEKALQPNASISAENTESSARVKHSAVSLTDGVREWLTPIFVEHQLSTTGREEHVSLSTSHAPIVPPCRHLGRRRFASFIARWFTVRTTCWRRWRTFASLNAAMTQREWPAIDKTIRHCHNYAFRVTTFHSFIHRHCMHRQNNSKCTLQQKQRKNCRSLK